MRSGPRSISPICSRGVSGRRRRRTLPWRRPPTTCSRTLVSTAPERAPFPGRAALLRRSPPNTQPRSLRSTMAPSSSRASPQGTQQPTPCSRRGRTTDGSVRLSGCPIHGPDTGGRSSIRLGSRSSTQPPGRAASSRSSFRAPRSSAPRHRSRSTAPRTRRSSTRSRIWAAPRGPPGRMTRRTSPSGGRARPS